MTNHQIIKQAYELFNRRNTDALLQLMTEDVEWPNGWEGGYLRTRAAVGEYWARQWAELDPHVEPVDIEELQDGRLQVRVHQVVKNKKGDLLADQFVYHVYTFEDHRIRHMEILEITA